MLCQLNFEVFVEILGQLGCWPDLINKEFTRLRRVNGPRV